MEEVTASSPPSGGMTISYHETTFSRVWSAAFLEYAANNPNQYTKWYEKFLGSSRGIPEYGDAIDWPSEDEVSKDTQVQEIFERGEVRVGFVPIVHDGKEHSPYGWYDGEPVDENLKGIEYEISLVVIETIAKKYKKALATKWIPYQVAGLNGTAADNGTMGSAIADYLTGTETKQTIDVGLNGLIDKQLPASAGCTFGWPTLTFFTGVMYTGMPLESNPNFGNEVRDLHFDGTGKSEAELYDDLVQLLKDNPGVKVVGMAGPSYDSAAFLYKKAYGFDLRTPSDDCTEATGASVVTEALKGETYHLIVADAMILGDYSTDESYDNLTNLNFSARFWGMGIENENTSAVDMEVDTNYMGPFFAK